MATEMEAYINYSQDITEQQKEEIFKLKSIIDSIPGSIYWKDKNGKYLGRNLYAAEKMVSINNENQVNIDSIIGKTDYDFFEKEIADQYRKHDLLVINSGKELITEEIVTTTNNEVITQLSTKRPLYDAHRNIVGIIGNTIDISYLKRVENDLRKTKGKLEVSTKIKDAFIQNMEHDIRTPFTGILGLANFLYEQEKDQAKKEHLNTIVLSAKQLLNYCNSILEYSKIEMETIPIVSKKFNLQELISNLIAAEKPAVINKKLTITCNHDKKIPKILVGDSYRIQRILINIISNAIKFTSKGGILIETNLVNKKNRDVIINIFVKDTGIGMSQNQINYIYEKFYRDSPSNKGLYTGLGLGLRIVKQFVDDLDGEIEVNSQPEKGSIFCCTFKFKLPLYAGEYTNG